MRKLALRSDERVVFDIFFAGIVSMAHCHPGAGVKKEGYDRAGKALSIEGCADLALEMIETRRKIMAGAEQEVWRGP